MLQSTRSRICCSDVQRGRVGLMQVTAVFLIVLVRVVALAKWVRLLAFLAVLWPVLQVLVVARVKWVQHWLTDTGRTVGTERPMHLCVWNPTDPSAEPGIFEGRRAVIKRCARIGRASGVSLS